MMTFTAILLPILFVSAKYENNTALSSQGQGFGPANSTEVSPMRVAAAAHFHLRGYIPPAASTTLLLSNSKPLHISAFKAKEEEDTSYIHVGRGLRRRKNKKKKKNRNNKKRNRNGNKKVKKNKKKGKSNKSSKRSKSKNGKR